MTFTKRDGYILISVLAMLSASVLYPPLRMIRHLGLEAAFNNSPLVHQIYIYGNSAQPHLLAVVVPTEDALARYDTAELAPLIEGGEPGGVAG